MKKVLFAVVFAALLTGISLAQSSTSPNSGSAAQQQGSTEMQTNPTPSQNTQATGEAAASGQIAPGTVIPAELAKSIDAKKAKQGDQVLAKTSQDLLSGGQVVIARGSKIIGHVTQAKPREKGESESTLGIAFDKLVMKDGHELPLNASIQALAGPPSMATGSAAPMSESGGMPGGMSGSASGGMEAGHEIPAPQELLRVCRAVPGVTHKTLELRRLRARVIERWLPMRKAWLGSRDCL